jgi:hypothetical protein
MDGKVTAGVEGRGFALAKQHALFEIDATVAVVATVNTTISFDCKVCIGNNSFVEPNNAPRLRVTELSRQLVGTMGHTMGHEVMLRTTE